MSTKQGETVSENGGSTKRTNLVTKQSLQCRNSSEGVRVDGEIERIEKQFLSGAFRQALVLSNDYLRRHAKTKKVKNISMRPKNMRRSDADQPFILIIPIAFKCRISCDAFRHRYLRVCCQKHEETITDMNSDRAASVSLQSWYEISKKAKHTKKGRAERRKRCIIEEGFRCLEPFFNQFFAETENDENSINRVMSLDLALIFIQFCVEAIDEVKIGLETAGAILDSFKQCNLPERFEASDETKEGAKDIIIYLFTQVIPKYHHLEFVELFLNRLASTTNSFEKSREEKTIEEVNLSPNSSKECIQQSLKFCTTKENQWPEWISDNFRDCRSTLQSMLQELYKEKIRKTSRCHRDVVLSPRDLGDKNYERSLITDDYMNRLKPDDCSKSPFLKFTSLRHILSWLKGFLQPHFLSSITINRRMLADASGRDKGIVVLIQTISAFTLWIAWRNRCSLSAAGRRALATIIIKPTVEIMEAFGIVQQT